MLDLILDAKINPILLSSFVGALRLFGDNLGKIEEINIKGLDVDMIIIYKYNLIFVAILDKEFVRHDLRREAEKALDMFYLRYQGEINEDYIDINQFSPFKDILTNQIKEYFKRIKESKKGLEIGDFGFFTEAIKRLKSNSA